MDEAAEGQFEPSEPEGPWNEQQGQIDYLERSDGYEMEEGEFG